MIYVRGRLLDEGEEMHGESEEAFRKAAQTIDGDLNLF